MKSEAKLALTSCADAVNRIRWSGLLLLAAALTPVIASSQTAALSIVPRVSVTETYTNNALLQGNGGSSDFITQISPGIRIFSNGGRIRGSLDYS
ncbi:MAG: hypothetical protein LH632_20855, partial [Rhodoferax sp.]|nr:hypothetical protein [Rhodoferax sp.]